MPARGHRDRARACHGEARERLIHVVLHGVCWQENADCLSPSVREPDVGCAERFVRRRAGSSVMQAGYVFRSGV